MNSRAFPAISVSNNGDQAKDMADSPSDLSSTSPPQRTSGTQNPNFLHSTTEVNFPLKGKLIAFTGFNEIGGETLPLGDGRVHVLGQYKECVGKLGGSTQSDLTRKTSVIIACRGLTRKRLTAQRHGIPVVLPHWLENGCTGDRHLYAVPWLYGYHFCVAHMAQEEKEALATVLQRHAARLSDDVTPSTDAVLVSSEYARDLRGMSSKVKRPIALRTQMEERRGAHREGSARLCSHGAVSEIVSLAWQREIPVMDYATFLRLAKLSDVESHQTLVDSAGAEDRQDFNTIAEAAQITVPLPPETRTQPLSPSESSVSSASIDESLVEHPDELFLGAPSEQSLDTGGTASADYFSEPVNMCVRSTPCATAEEFISQEDATLADGVPLSRQVSLYYEAQKSKRELAPPIQSASSNGLKITCSPHSTPALFPQPISRPTLARVPLAWMPPLTPRGIHLVVSLVGHTPEEYVAAVKFCAVCRFLLNCTLCAMSDVLVLGSQLARRKKVRASRILGKAKHLRGPPGNTSPAPAQYVYEAPSEVRTAAAALAGIPSFRIAPFAWLRECYARVQIHSERGLDFSTPAETMEPVPRQSDSVTTPVAGEPRKWFLECSLPPVDKGPYRIQFRSGDVEEPQSKGLSSQDAAVLKSVQSTAGKTRAPHVHSSHSPLMSRQVSALEDIERKGSASQRSDLPSLPNPAHLNAERHQRERQMAHRGLNFCLQLICPGPTSDTAVDVASPVGLGLLSVSSCPSTQEASPATTVLPPKMSNLFQEGYFCLVNGDFSRVDSSVARGLVKLCGGCWIKKELSEWRSWLSTFLHRRASSTRHSDDSKAVGSEDVSAQSNRDASEGHFLEIVRQRIVEEKRKKRHTRKMRCTDLNGALRSNSFHSVHLGSPESPIASKRETQSPLLASPPMMESAAKGTGTRMESTTAAVFHLVPHHYQKPPLSNQSTTHSGRKRQRCVAAFLSDVLPHIPRVTSDYLLCCMAAERWLDPSTFFLFHTPIPSAAELSLKSHQATASPTAAPPSRSDWVWHKRYRKPDSVGVCVCFVYRMPSNLMEKNSFGEGGGLQFPSPSALSVLKVLLLALHHTVQSLGGTVHDVYSVSAVTHVVLVDVEKIYRSCLNGDEVLSGGVVEWPSADLDALRGVPSPEEVCLVTEKWLEECLQWGMFIAEDISPAYQWSLPPLDAVAQPTHSTPLSEPAPAPPSRRSMSLPRGISCGSWRRSATVSPAPLLHQQDVQHRLLSAEQVARRQSLSQRCTSVAKRLRDQLSPRFSGVGPGKAIAISLSLEERAEGTRPSRKPSPSPTPQRHSDRGTPSHRVGSVSPHTFNFETPGKSPTFCSSMIGKNCEEEPGGSEPLVPFAAAVELPLATEEAFQCPAVQKPLREEIPDQGSANPKEDINESPCGMASRDTDAGRREAAIAAERGRKRKRSATPPPLQLAQRLCTASTGDAGSLSRSTAAFSTGSLRKLWGASVAPNLWNVYVLHDIPDREELMAEWTSLCTSARKKCGPTTEMYPGGDWVKIGIVAEVEKAVIVATHEVRSRASILAAVAAGMWLVKPSFLLTAMEALREAPPALLNASPNCLPMLRGALEYLLYQHEWSNRVRRNDVLSPSARLILRRASYYREQRFMYGVRPFRGMMFVLCRFADDKRKPDHQLDGVVQVIRSGGGGVCGVVKVSLRDYTISAAVEGSDKAVGITVKSSLLNDEEELEQLVLHLVCAGLHHCVRHSATPGSSNELRQEVVVLWDTALLQSSVLNNRPADSKEARIEAQSSAGSIPSKHQTLRAWLQSLDFLQNTERGKTTLRRTVEQCGNVADMGDIPLTGMNSVDRTRCVVQTTLFSSAAKSRPNERARAGTPLSEVLNPSHCSFKVTTAEMRSVMDWLLTVGGTDEQLCSKELLLTQAAVDIPSKSFR